eukprot:gene29149-40520_t
MLRVVVCSDIAVRVAGALHWIFVALLFVAWASSFGWVLLRVLKRQPQGGIAFASLVPPLLLVCNIGTPPLSLATAPVQLGIPAAVYAGVQLRRYV